jgi:hypothetical protein
MSAYITCRVNPVDLKNRLCDVETDCRDRLHVWLLRIVGVPVEEPSTASQADIRIAAKIAFNGQKEAKPPSRGATVASPQYAK